MAESYAIKTNKLGRDFSDTPAVKDVSIAIRAGEIYGFLGPNGAGKSTMLRMLVGLLMPTSGSATILGHDVVKQAHKVRLLIGATLQEASLDENQTGREIMELQGRLYGLRKQEIRERLNELSGLVDIGPALDDRIKTYSGGMKRRVDLASSLVHNPLVLFLDEPTTGLDPVSRTKVWQEVRHLNTQLGMTIFLTTQYLEEADELADRIGIIDKGRIVEEDTPKNLKTRIGSDVIDIHLSNTPEVLTQKIRQLPGVRSIDVHKNVLSIRAKNASKILGQIVEDITRQNLTIMDMSVRQPTMDDVFLKVTGHATEVEE